MLFVPYFRFLLRPGLTLHALHMYLDGRDATRSDICDIDKSLSMVRYARC